MPVWQWQIHQTRCHIIHGLRPSEYHTKNCAYRPRTGFISLTNNSLSTRNIYSRSDCRYARINQKNQQHDAFKTPPPAKPRKRLDISYTPFTRESWTTSRLSERMTSARRTHVEYSLSSHQAGLLGAAGSNVNLAYIQLIKAVHDVRLSCTFRVCASCARRASLFV